MMKYIKYLLFTFVVLILLYFAGPTTPKPVLNHNLPAINGSVINYVAKMESRPEIKIRPNCEARIIWANDSTHEPTEFVLLYLHGFSASWREGFPVNMDFARYFECNAFLARLASHGVVTDDPLLDMTPDRLYESAKEALMVARQLGKKVVIMACSTGCTLALKLASDYPDMVHGMILYSPNVKIKQKSAIFLSRPWGLQIARMAYGGDFVVTDHDPSGEICKYWNCRYRCESIVYLQQLLDATMKKEIFEKISCPVLMGYYYKNDELQDQIVEVKAALQMMGELGTPDTLKRMVAFENAGNHVIACDLTSGSVPEVRSQTFAFAEAVLGMKPKR